MEKYVFLANPIYFKNTYTSYWICRNGMNGHILNNLEWVPMMKRGMRVLIEVKWKNRFLYVLRVCHELRNMINSVLHIWSQKWKKGKQRQEKIMYTV